MSKFTDLIEEHKKSALESGNARFSLRIPRNQHSMIQRLADDVGISMNDLILCALQAAYSSYTGTELHKPDDMASELDKPKVE
ncbi:hypothetical protein ACFQ14_03315 [Pseudahrensia aquimaris]|uniref:Toxin-antitoxin system HicB family antitoxin n=1 Tax=Pseudahrensia aquimaris TaxID=744461 RepID=A0ABW3FAE4_9HYPH